MAKTQVRMLSYYLIASLNLFFSHATRVKLLSKGEVVSQGQLVGVYSRDYMA